MQKAIVACGCFWQPEEKFRKTKGVTSTEVGYCGGNNLNVSYKEVCGGNTGHAEVVKLQFDENIISERTVIRIDVIVAVKLFRAVSWPVGQGPLILSWLMPEGEPAPEVLPEPKATAGDSSR